MSETTGSTTSETNPGGGSVGDGSGATGTQAGLVPQAQLEQAEARRRATQSALDKALSGQTALEQRLAQMESLMSNFDPTKIADTIQSRLAQASAMQAAAGQLKEQFPNARTDVFEQSFDSIEALKAAVEQSHTAETEYRRTVRDEEFGKLADQARAAGLTLDPSPQTASAGDGGDGNGPLTAAHLASMDFNELMKLDDAQIARAMSVT